LPHAEGDVPVRQMDPSQQPVAQLVALQVGVPTQAPPEQTGVPPAQLVHAPPPRPQAPDADPIWQTPPWQQPGQLPGPHGAAWQEPELQTGELPLQLLQVLPALPHALA
jgi:hypothetical protein